MKKIALVICASFLFVACSKPATETPTTQSSEAVPTATELATPVVSPSLILTLGEQNKSGQSGIATLEEVDGKVQVTISLTGQKDGTSAPAHFHTGTCTKPGAVVYPLSNVVNGTSVTLIDATLADVKANSTLLNIHKSATESKVYTACGEWGAPTGAAPVDASSAPAAPGMPN